MKKYIITVTAIILVLFSLDWLYFYQGVYFDFGKEKEIHTFMKVDGETIYMQSGSEYQPFEIRGVNMGSGIPGEWSTSFAIDKETYKRWFSYIQQMGANTIRVYTMQNGNLYKPDSMDMGDKMNENGDKMTPPRDMGAMPDFQGKMPSDMNMPASDEGESGNNPPPETIPDDFRMPPQPMDGKSDIRQRPDQKQQRTSEQGERMPSPFDRGGRGGNNGANLNYTDDNLDSYSAIWDGEVTKTTDADNKRVVTALKNISLGSNLEKYLDIDNVLKYMAVHSFVVNDDSLSGNMAHNYYLYESGGTLNILPWDYNLAFGGMRSSDASYVINDPIDTPFSATKFFDALLKDEQYLERYHDYYNQLVNGYVFSGEFQKTYNRIKEQISDLVKTDPNSMYTFDEFVAASDMLYSTVMLRAQSIKGQLDGTIPSTSEAQRTNPDALLDASSIDISIMGEFHGGDRSNGERENKFQKRTMPN